MAFGIENPTLILFLLSLLLGKRIASHWLDKRASSTANPIVEIESSIVIQIRTSSRLLMPGGILFGPDDLTGGLGLIMRITGPIIHEAVHL